MLFCGKEEDYFKCSVVLIIVESLFMWKVSKLFCVGGFWNDVIKD